MMRHPAVSRCGALLLTFGLLAGCQEESEKTSAEKTSAKTGANLGKTVAESDPGKSAPTEPAPAADGPIEVGQPAPNFELQNQDGETLTLASARGDKDYVALVFYRSANW